MKAVVVEIKGQHAALLQDDGQIIKVKNHQFALGDVVNPLDYKMSFVLNLKHLAAVAAVFIAMVSGSTFAYFTPYYHVSVDVNPSVLLIANRFERVLKVKGLNHDASVLLENQTLRHKSLKVAVDQVFVQLDQAGFMDQSEEVIIATASKNKESARRMSEKLSQLVDKEVGERFGQAAVHSDVIDMETVHEAEISGVSPGRLNRNLDSGKSEDAGRPENPGKSEDAGRPENPGKSEDAGRAENPGKPEDVGRPENLGKSEDAGKPENPGKSEDVGRPENPGKSEDAGRPENPGKSEDAGRPENPGKSEDAGRPENPGKGIGNPNKP